VLGVIAVVVATAMLGLPPAHAAAARVGTKGGVDFATFRGDFDELVGFDTRTCAAIGGFVMFDFGAPVALQVEAMYMQKGAKTEVQDTGPSGNPIRTFEWRYELDYLEVPVLARIGLGSAGPVRPYVIAGPSFGFALGGHVESERGSLDLPDMKALDFGVAGGLGAEAVAGPYRVGLEGRYATGVSDLYDIGGNLESINSVFSILVFVSR
jgi:hypothetical protein